PERGQRDRGGRSKATPTAEPDTPGAAARAEREGAGRRRRADGGSTHQGAGQRNEGERTSKNSGQDRGTRRKRR
ncbi:DNA-binding response regulator, partial [Mycobacterium tuberculosis]